MAHIDKTVSDEVMEKMKWKKEILRAKKLFEATAQVPSPSKDFTQIILTERGVVWRRWKITLRGISQGAAPSPSEEAMTHEDFQYDTAFQNEIERILGSEVLRQIRRILSGSRDDLSKLPEKTMVHVCTYLDLQSITQLSQVNRHLREVCSSNSLWEKLYRVHQGVPSEETAALARDIGWKMVFFMNKLQLQKELSRRRRLHSAHTSNSTASNGKSTTFLTQ